MSDLKKQLIKLGSTNPELRPHIRAILAANADPSRLRHLGIGNHSDVQLVDNLPVGLEVYTYSIQGENVVFAVTSRAKKPFYHRYVGGNVDRAVKKIIEEWNAAIAQKKQRKEEERYKGGLKVGDILYAIWGYDQTNVDWYQVVGTPSPSMVEIREISGKRMGRDTVSANKDSFIGPVMRKRAQGTGDRLRVKINSHITARIWDGKPTYETPFDQHR